MQLHFIYSPLKDRGVDREKKKNNEQSINIWTSLESFKKIYMSTKWEREKRLEEQNLNGGGIVTLALCQHAGTGFNPPPHRSPPQILEQKNRNHHLSLEFRKKK